MKIAVLLGGLSSERDVSIASGAQIFKALRGLGHEVMAIDTAKGKLNPEEEEVLLQAGISETPPDQEKLSAMGSNLSTILQSPDLRSVDVIFLALHGGTGEDGTIQALLDLVGIPYTGSGHLASAIAMDKNISKKLFRASGVPTPEWIMAPADEQDVKTCVGYPAVVKPNKEGSTVGLTIVKEPGRLEAAIDTAYSYDKEVLIEQFIPGRELTVGILDDRPLAVGEIIPKQSEIFDYRSKYQPGATDEIFPADITEEQAGIVRELALKAHRALKLEGYSRVDFRMDASGQFWCLEANNLPGMASASLLPQSAKATGIDFPSLCEKICLLAMERHKSK